MTPPRAEPQGFATERAVCGPDAPKVWPAFAGRRTTLAIETKGMRTAVRRHGRTLRPVSFVTEHIMAKLTCFPVPCGCGKHAHPADLPPRMAHSKSDRCPFVTDEYQSEVLLGTCCTFNAQELVESLLFWNDSEPAACVRKGQATCSEAAAFGRWLEDICECIFDTHGHLDERKKKEREALGHADMIGAASSWYQKVAAHGFGVMTEGSC